MWGLGELHIKTNAFAGALAYGIDSLESSRYSRREISEYRYLYPRASRASRGNVILDALANASEGIGSIELIEGS